jgi:hypothetical protein
MRTILAQHARRYENWGVADLYKLIHQASHGSEHALGDETQVRHRLERELAQLGPGKDEPLIDPISPDGRIVRIHLRPFARRHLNEEALLKAFILTGSEFHPSADRLIEYAAVAGQLAQEGVLSFSEEEISRYIDDLRTSGFPAVHHSWRYTQDYQPAYRVVAWEFLPDKPSWTSIAPI